MSCHNEDNAPPCPTTPSLCDLLTPAQTARLTGHPATVLAVYRSRRNTGQSSDAGPDFIKHGTAVFYARTAVQAYIAGRG
ncbi:MAG: hypothetical protein ACRBB0_05095 [Pelagimonas sp.]|uniref:hypothetical protein n=1 Tax=Pelagimonas sp. TaxID=2073170 RepID=UPI003D6C4DD6